MNNWLEQAREKLTVPKVAKNNHHILHHSRTWGAYGIGSDVRGRIIARGMPVELHELLHEQEAPVPVPEYHSLLHVYQNLSAGLNVIQAMDKYCVLLNRANQHPKIRPIEIQLNELSIMAVQAQVPYVRQYRS